MPPSTPDHCPLSRYACWLMALLLLNGCAFSYISPEAPETFIPDRSTEVASAGLDRPTVRRVLGEPLLSSMFWGFDLFRTRTEQSEWVFAITPWPVPFLRVADRLERYTLIAYDAAGVTTGVATGIFRRPSDWRSGSPIRSDYASLYLRADDLLGFLDPQGEREINLLAAPAARDRYVGRIADANASLVVLGCGDRACPDQLAVDAGPRQRLPLRTALIHWSRPEDRDPWLKGVDGYSQDASRPWLEALAAITLPAGKHLLAFSAEHLGGTHSLELDCRPGQTTYLVVDAASDDALWKPTLIDWRIDPSLSMPPRFARRPLVLMYEGQWRVDAE